MQSSVFNNQRLHPLIREVAALIRETRSELDDLELLLLDPDLKEIYGKLNDEEILILNEFHKARGFRKLHLEIAILGKSLQILHCVFFPNYCYNLPIFGVDIVVTLDEVSAAIVDLSPVSKDLPSAFLTNLKNLNDFNFINARELPDWGNIFSPYVCFVKPINSQEEKAFSELVENYLKMLISVASSMTSDSPQSYKSKQRLHRQKLYCINQKKNNKTRNLLSKVFNPSWADRYIDIVLFDIPLSL